MLPHSIDERLASVISEAEMEGLIEIASAGHPMRIDPDYRTLHFDNGFTGPDDILRFREHLPALKNFKILLAVAD